MGVPASAAAGRVAVRASSLKVIASQGGVLGLNGAGNASAGAAISIAGLTCRI